ncbi:MAG TPA: hypothetical protein VNQ90_20145 [Chthoniobacteraceae bacterium]|nr:hypothetical protein [Chthoniobacteraceae bacterium]
MKILDVNAAAGFWPIQRFSFQTLEELDQVFEASQVETAWVSAIESILYPDPETHDHRLFEKIGAFPRLRPVKTVNPLLANWERSCQADLARHPIAALKLFPNYHGYSLAHPEVEALCRFAMERRLPVVVSVRVNDERNQPVAMQVAGVPVEEIAALSLKFPELLLMATSAYKTELKTLATGSENLLCDISFVDGDDTLALAAATMPVDRLVFGSHAPFLHVASAVLKVGGYSSLLLSEREKVAAGNVLQRA